MKIAELPFNRLLGLVEGGEDGALVSLPGDAAHGNHLGTVHAGALMTVAEAASGEFLLRRFGSLPGVVPVVRHFEAKFRAPATGMVRGRATAANADEWLPHLADRGRVLAPVQVEVVDAAGTVVMTATVTWFVSRASERPPR